MIFCDILFSLVIVIYWALTKETEMPVKWIQETEVENGKFRAWAQRKKEVVILVTSRWCQVSTGDEFARLLDELSRRFDGVEFRRFDPHTRFDIFDCLHILHTDVPSVTILQRGKEVDGGRFRDPSSIMAIEMMLSQLTDPTKHHAGTPVKA